MTYELMLLSGKVLQSSKESHLLLEAVLAQMITLLPSRRDKKLPLDASS